MAETLSGTHCPSPSKTRFELGALKPTSPSQSRSSLPPFPPLITQPPAFARRAQDDSCPTTPNEVLLKISTQVFIPDYSTFYTATPIEQFSMTYSSFPDGSLVAPPYISEIHHGDWTLLFSGMMLMLFITNSVVSADFIRRGRVKYKGLFYALLFSQVCGVISFTINAATVISNEINCRAALVAAGIFTELSSAILLSGILGVKAYRCLDESRTVLAVIIILQIASSTMAFLDLAKLDASRRLSMTCISTRDSLLFSLSTTFRFCIAMFICFCFIYALWKSEKVPAAQGRVSIYASGPNPPVPPVTIEKEGSNPTRSRGWWDYVPESRANLLEADQSRTSTWHVVDDQGFVGNMRYFFGAWMKDATSPEDSKRKGSEATLVAPQNQRLSKPSLVHFQDDIQNVRFSVASNAQSSTSSKTWSLRPLMNRMRLFREVMRNELAYTALITLFNVIATILGLVGAFAHLPVDPEFFIGAYWGILSLLIVHSFRRVVERHEREAFLQDPATWDALYRAEKATNGDTRRHLKSASFISNPWKERETPDPFARADENISPRDVQEGPSRTAANAVENPFEDFKYAGTHPAGESIGGAGRKRLPSRARTESLLPEAPVLSGGKGKSQDRFSARQSDQFSRDSVSKYSDTSSRPHSLFYLEGRQ